MRASTTGITVVSVVWYATYACISGWSITTSMLSMAACRDSVDCRDRVACQSGLSPKILLASMAMCVLPKSACRGCAIRMSAPLVWRVACSQSTSGREGWLLGIWKLRRLLGSLAAIPLALYAMPISCRLPATLPLCKSISIRSSRYICTLAVPFTRPATCMSLGKNCLTSAIRTSILADRFAHRLPNGSLTSPCACREVCLVWAARL